jgi:precorrin-6B methylase 2
MSARTLREEIARWKFPIHPLSVLAAAIDARITGKQVPPEIHSHFNDVLEVLKVRELIENADREELVSLRTDILCNLAVGAKLAAGEYTLAGWTYNEPEILNGIGASSGCFPAKLSKFVFPTLAGLNQRLESRDGKFLDIGVGVGALSLEMASIWPSLQIVGIDAWEPSLKIARENLNNAGLADRIELKMLLAQDLAAESEFDLVWIPSPFISHQILRTVLDRVFIALKPGAWMLCAMLKKSADPLISALTRLRTSLWGGGSQSLTEAEKMAIDSGFEEVQLASLPDDLGLSVVAGRKPSAKR